MPRTRNSAPSASSEDPINVDELSIVPDAQGFPQIIQENMVADSANSDEDIRPVNFESITNNIIIFFAGVTC